MKGVRSQNLYILSILLQVAFILLFTSLVHAETRAKVVLLTAERESTVVHRIDAELNALEIEVIIVNVSDANRSTHKELRRIAQEYGAFAAVRIIPSADEAEVWVMDRVTGKTLVREIVSGKDAGSFEDAISLGTVELLRASLLEVSSVTELKGDVPTPTEVKALLPPIAPTKPQAKSPTTNPIETKAYRPKAYLQIGILPAVDFGVKQLTTGTSVELDLKITNRDGWGAELLGRSPFSAQRVHQHDGSAEIRTQQFGILGCYAPQQSLWSPTLSLGFLAANVTADGQADAPFRTQKQSRLRVMPALRVGIGYRFLPAVVLRTDVTLGYSLVPLEIHIAGKNAADFGRPSLALGAGLEFRLPLDADVVTSKQSMKFQDQ
jgi:hypothetical protein